ncbi:MAG: D-alanine--D-alanine ligase [Chloroflexaceae bacterium]|nr:D-alanine--D-alanine ligase [Chloroflexaceae bacterium]
MSLLRILHLVGSVCDDFYCDLSRLYAQDCLVATANPSRYEFHIAYISCDRHWRFPSSLSQAAIAAAPPRSFSQAIDYIIALNIDVVLPQMFCIPGMTQYRALFELLKIPYIGNRAEVMAIAAHKAKAKAIVAAAGVKVPSGQLLRRGELPTLKPPAVIKPVSADNSLGVSFVREIAEYGRALDAAFDYADEVLVEEYIELGREVRCGILAWDERLVGLPLEEYAVNQRNHPIRYCEDKLQRVESGDLSLSAKDPTKAWIVDPGDPITPTVQKIAKTCHQALGCQHYSLFDFRIDPWGQPWFLEAGLYCSFSPKSVLVTMARAAGISLADLMAMMLELVRQHPTHSWGDRYPLPLHQ